MSEAHVNPNANSGIIDPAVIDAKNSITTTTDANGVAVPNGKGPIAAGSPTKTVALDGKNPETTDNTAVVAILNAENGPADAVALKVQSLPGGSEKQSIGSNIVLPPPGGLELDQEDSVSGTNVPGFLLQLVDALKQFFNPGGDQIFTLQFPGRFLSQDEYAWDTDLAGIYGQFIKPVAVNESEFRLADGLYDLTDRVGAPNGTNLSIVYEQLLNNLLPKYVDNGLPQQQNQIRQWLMQDVPMSQWIKDIMERQQERERKAANDGKKSDTPVKGGGQKMFDMSSKDIESGETLNRIELSELLMNEYLYAKQDWELERDAMINEASQADIGSLETQKQLNNLTRKLAHITTARQAQLASKYSDAVVRGYTHTIKDYMGYIDISSPSEALQNAKDSLREAAMSSLDGAMKVYPIQFTPLDWFEGLSTSFTMEDLTQDPEMIRMQIKSKSQQIDTLDSQLMLLQTGKKGDAKELEGRVETARANLDTAQSTLAQTYTTNVISMAKTYLNKEGQVNISDLSAATGVSPEALTDLQAQMDAVKAAQDTLTSSSRALSQLYAAQALAEATDTRQQEQYIGIQSKTLKRELRELETRWASLTGANDGNPPSAPADTSNQTLPTTPLELPQNKTSGGSRWQELHFTSDASKRNDFSESHSQGEDTTWSCNLWIASASGSNSQSSAASATRTSSSSDTIDIAFRCTQVTIDRGGWFQPQFFKESKAFYKINPDITWEGKSGLMPGYPMSFIIAKDIVIRIRHDRTANATQKQYDKAESAASGGFLCFSYSNSNSSTSESQSSSFQAYDNGFIVKIPGPQILGYMIQKTAPDLSQQMPRELPPNFFIPDDDYNRNLVPRNDVEEPPTNEGKEPAQEGPKISVDRLRDVIKGLLDERLNDVFEKIKGDTGPEGGVPASVGV